MVDIFDVVALLVGFFCFVLMHSVCWVCQTTECIGHRTRLLLSNAYFTVVSLDAFSFSLWYICMIGLYAIVLCALLSIMFDWLRGR